MTPTEALRANIERLARQWEAVGAASPCEPGCRCERCQHAATMRAVAANLRRALDKDVPEAPNEPSALSRQEEQPQRRPARWWGVVKETGVYHCWFLVQLGCHGTVCGLSSLDTGVVRPSEPEADSPICGKCSATQPQDQGGGATEPVSASDLASGQQVEPGAAKESAAPAPTAGLQSLFGAVSFLRSCLRSGEALSAAEDAAIDAHLDAAERERDEARSQLAEAHRAAEKEEAACLQVIDERDRAVDAADEMAGAIGHYFGFEIGEHSNTNLPWRNAIDGFPSDTLAEAKKGIEAERDRLRKALDSTEVMLAEASVTLRGFLKVHEEDHCDEMRHTGMCASAKLQLAKIGVRLETRGALAAEAIAAIDAALAGKPAEAPALEWHDYATGIADTRLSDGTRLRACGDSGGAATAVHVYRPTLAEAKAKAEQIAALLGVRRG